MLQRLKTDSKFLMLVLLVLSLLILVVYVLVSGFTLWFFVSLVLLVIFLVLFSRLFLKFGFVLVVITFVVILVLSVSTMFVFNGKRVSSTTTTPKLTAEECKPYISKYDNKVLKITGDNAKGTIGIKISSDCKLSARYIFTFSGTLPENPIPDIAISSLYNHVCNLHNASQTSRGHYGVGVLSAVRQNEMSLPEPFAPSNELANFYRDPNDNGTGPTNNFYWSLERSGNFSEKFYQELFDDNVFEVINGLPFMKKEVTTDGMTTYTIDHEKAEVEGEIIKTIKLTITE